MEAKEVGKEWDARYVGLLCSRRGCLSRGEALQQKQRGREGRWSERQTGEVLGDGVKWLKCCLSEKMPLDETSGMLHVMLYENSVI